MFKHRSVLFARGGVVVLKKPAAAVEQPSAPPVASSPDQQQQQQQWRRALLQFSQCLGSAQQQQSRRWSSSSSSSSSPSQSSSSVPRYVTEVADNFSAIASTSRHHSSSTSSSSPSPLFVESMRSATHLVLRNEALLLHSPSSSSVAPTRLTALPNTSSTLSSIEEQVCASAIEFNIRSQTLPALRVFFDRAKERVVHSSMQHHQHQHHHQRHLDLLESAEVLTSVSESRAALLASMRAFSESTTGATARQVSAVLLMQHAVYHAALDRHVERSKQRQQQQQQLHREADSSEAQLALQACILAFPHSGFGQLLVGGGADIAAAALHLSVFLSDAILIGAGPLCSALLSFIRTSAAVAGEDDSSAAQKNSAPPLPDFLACRLLRRLRLFDQRPRYVPPSSSSLSNSLLAPFLEESTAGGGQQQKHKQHQQQKKQWFVLSPLRVQSSSWLLQDCLAFSTSALQVAVESEQPSDVDDRGHGRSVLLDATRAVVVCLSAMAASSTAATSYEVRKGLLPPAFSLLAAVPMSVVQSACFSGAKDRRPLFAFGDVVCETFRLACLQRQHKHKDDDGAVARRVVADIASLQQRIDEHGGRSSSSEIASFSSWFEEGSSSALSAVVDRVVKKSEYDLLSTVRIFSALAAEIQRRDAFVAHIRSLLGSDVAAAATAYVSVMSEQQQTQQHCSGSPAFMQLPRILQRLIHRAGAVPPGRSDPFTSDLATAIQSDVTAPTLFPLLLHRTLQSSFQLCNADFCRLVDAKSKEGNNVVPVLLDLLEVRRQTCLHRRLALIAEESQTPLGSFLSNENGIFFASWRSSAIYAAVRVFSIQQQNKTKSAIDSEYLFATLRYFPTAPAAKFEAALLVAMWIVDCGLVQQRQPLALIKECVGGSDKKDLFGMATRVLSKIYDEEKAALLQELLK